MRYFLQLFVFVFSTISLGLAQNKIPAEALVGVENKPAKLSYRFQPNYVYPFTHMLNGSLNFLGMEVNWEHTLYGKVEVVSQKDNWYKTKGTIERVVLKTIVPESKPFVIDSEQMNRSDVREGNQLKELIRTPFIYHVDTRGQIAHFEQAIAGLYKQLKDRIPAKFQESFKGELTQQMQMFQEIFPRLPKASQVQQGYYWVIPRDYPLGPLGLLQSKNLYRYLGVVNYQNVPCAKLLLESKSLFLQPDAASMMKAIPALRKLGIFEIKSPGESEGPDALPIQVKFDKGTLKGEIYVSLANGETIFQKLEGDVTLMISLLGGDPSESTLRFTVSTAKQGIKPATKKDPEESEESEESEE